jgi:predicted RNase H-like HicB family nuclease
MKRLHDYTVVIRPEDNGTFVAYIPAISGCHAWGRTPEEAQAELANVFTMVNDKTDNSSEKSKNSIHISSDGRNSGIPNESEKVIDTTCPRCKRECIFDGEILRMELVTSSKNVLIMDTLNMFLKLNPIWDGRAKQKKVTFKRNYFN